ncbi:MAG: carboxynorspermidine decarboxylase [Prevotellaceae bacterium]|jgi:carboxynorspermidine decarboxylase|nr:carboxynorspermidine decarboxylase [Prevotellaceae bacterium]
MTIYHRTEIPSPCFVINEAALRKNLALIASVKQRAGVEIILAFKAFALWKTFPIIREYIAASTASSLAEARLACDEMGNKAHTYAPVYTEEEFDGIAACSSHVTFNSLTQYEKHQATCRKYGISCGLRINPEYSDVATTLYNPCAEGSRLGITAAGLRTLPDGIEGLHFHTLCESTSYDLERTLTVVEAKFGRLFSQIKWLNMGGGHLMTRADYDTEHLIAILHSFKARYPHLRLILEPGSAFAWQTGILKARVEDIVTNGNIQTAMLNVSFACHMPDCLEMPYKPTITHAMPPSTPNLPTYRMGGNSCLSGDFIGEWSFKQPLSVGDVVIFEDMIHYTTVKTTLFNGVSHPAIGIIHTDDTFELLRTFDYEDYKQRMN